MKTMETRGRATTRRKPRARLRRSGTAIALACAVAALAAVLVPGAAAATGPEQQLAEKYAPVLGLKEHEPCADTGEPYRPVPVEAVLGQSDVVLLGPDGAVVKTAPTAADLFGKGDGYRLDFPGDPLHAGCSYEQWFDRIAAGKATTAYAHIVGEQGKLALQYWFYYPFNDWNNKHESDWEMIQLVFDAPTAEAALGQTPALVGTRSTRAERPMGRRQARSVTDIHRLLRGGLARQPFVQSLYLGTARRPGSAATTPAGRPTTSRHASSCARGSDRAGRTVARLGFLGNWGQKVSGPNSGPTGPTFKGQSTEPITWVDEDWRPDGLQSPRRARSRRRRPGSSARRSRRGPRSTSASCATRSSCSGSSPQSRCSPRGSRAGRPGRPLPIRSGSAATPVNLSLGVQGVSRSAAALPRHWADGDPPGSARSAGAESVVRRDGLSAVADEAATIR